jgi:hypothetical protein
MRAHRRKLLFLVSTVVALGMALAAAQPTEFHERFDGTAAPKRARWVPGTVLPMSAFEPSVTPAPMPH